MKKSIFILIFFIIIINFDCKMSNVDEDSRFDIRGRWSYRIFNLDHSLMTSGNWELSGGESHGRVGTIPPSGGSSRYLGSYEVIESKRVKISLIPVVFGSRTETRKFEGDIATDNSMTGIFYYLESPAIHYEWQAFRWR